MAVGGGGKPGEGPKGRKEGFIAKIDAANYSLNRFLLSNRYQIPHLTKFQIYLSQTLALHIFNPIIFV